MAPANPDAERQCREHLDRFFESYLNPVLKRSSKKALRLMAAFDEPLTGRPEGWAAGIIYAMANRHRIPCGVPGLLNADFERVFGVTMSTVRKRAAQVDRAMDKALDI